jgi:putative Mg2+ transporter-C (MgtC) family protein
MAVMMIDGFHLVIPLQIVVAAVLGAAIGLEREISAQPAGLRTHMLVSLGAALFTLAGSDTAHTDPTRIAAQVVTGVGFLGGGAILREGVTVRGITTAATLWLTAAIGVAVGLEKWGAAIVTTILGLAVLVGVRIFERDVLPGRRPLEVTITLEVGASLDDVVDQVEQILARSRVTQVSYDAAGQKITLTSQPTQGYSLTHLAEALRALTGVQGVAINR